MQHVIGQKTKQKNIPEVTIVRAVLKVGGCKAFSSDYEQKAKIHLNVKHIFTKF